jgi:bromodomain and PHD finger-containing protein 1
MLDNEANEDNIVCDICLEGDDEEGDEIVICELCSAATHQACYGGEIKTQLPGPDQPWYCARCEHLIKNKTTKATDIQCVLCPNLQGIMKPFTIDGKVQ